MTTTAEWLESRIKVLIPEDIGSQLMFKSNIAKAKEMEKQRMIEFAEYVATYSDKNKNANGEMLHAKSKYDGAERTADLLETFTKNRKP